MFELKPLSREAIPRALEKAERYRLLNEPGQAESICLDMLRIDPDNQQALVMLLLALTDQFEGPAAEVKQAQEVLRRLKGEYERAYYGGIVYERRAKAVLHHGALRSRYAAHDLFREAMTCYERAEAIRPPGNDDAVLRWNTCARVLMSHPELESTPEERVEQPLE
jgi:tetratricopeptide (TPR) repeat protein